MATIAETLGPEALIQYIDPSEAIKRLAAAQGIDVLNLDKSQEQLDQEKAMLQRDSAQQSIVDQTGQLAGTPLMDPTKNPQLAEQAQQVLQNIVPPPQQ